MTENNMPDVIFASNDGHGGIAASRNDDLDGGEGWGIKYTRASLSPPVPDDVAEAVKRCQSNENYNSNCPTSWAQFRISDVKILINAVKWKK